MPLPLGMLRSGKGDELEPDGESSVCLLMEGAQPGGSGCPGFPGNQGDSVHYLAFIHGSGPMPLKRSPMRGGHVLPSSATWVSLETTTVSPGLGDGATRWPFPDLLATLDGGTGIFLSLGRLRHETT